MANSGGPSVQFLERLQSIVGHPGVAYEMVQASHGEQLGCLLGGRADALRLGDVEIDEKEPPVLVLGLEFLQAGRAGGAPGGSDDGVVLVLELLLWRKQVDHYYPQTWAEWSRASGSQTHQLGGEAQP